MAKQQNILAIEMSQQHGSITMSNRAGVSVMYPVETGRRDEDNAMVSIALAAKTLCISKADIEIIIVSIGPGGFTGLRISVAFAKMISYTTGAKVIPVESAIVVAHGANKGNGPFLVVSSVKQDSYWLSRVEFHDNVWVCKGELSKSAEFIQHTEGITAVFADEFLPVAVQETMQTLDIPLLQSTWSAASLLEIGQRFAELDKHIDPLFLLPLYPREPEAVRKWNEMRLAK